MTNKNNNKKTFCSFLYSNYLTRVLSYINMQIQKNVSLKPYNTFGVDVSCNQLICVDREDEIPYLFQEKVFDTRFFILGGGSNVLFTQNYDGNIVHMRTKGIDIVKETENEVFIKVAAGELWDDFVDFCIRHAYYGIENLTGIPGLVGSSPVQNIGAYGVELKDVMHSVEGIYVADNKSFVLNNADCKFAYRSSVFKKALKNKCLVTQVLFRLSKIKQFTLTYKALRDELPSDDADLDLQKVAQAVLHVRNSKLPDVRKIGSAGSFFKNPVIPKSRFVTLIDKYPSLIHFDTDNGEVKLAAGQLVEMAGWKGKRLNDAGVYPLQALVIVNYGNAGGKELLDLSMEIQKDVFERFEIQLEPEVNIMF